MCRHKSVLARLLLHLHVDDSITLHRHIHSTVVEWATHMRMYVV